MKNIIYLPILLLIFASCQQENLYKKSFTVAEKKKMADQLILAGQKNSYQGSVTSTLLFQEASIIDPENSHSWRELGIPYAKRGIGKDFQKYYSKAVVLNPEEWQGWRGYIYLYFYRDYKRAIKDFDELDALTPNFVDYPQSTSVHFMRGIAYLKLGEYEAALNYWEKHFEEELKTTSPDYIAPEAFVFHGMTYLKMGQTDKALEIFEYGIENRPKNADLKYWAAQIAIQNEEFSTAKKLLSQAKINFKEGYFNHRPYVEEFFQIYMADIKEALFLLNKKGSS